MISSVVAKFRRDDPANQLALNQIASHPALEVGELIDGRSLPITIESHGNNETEEITRWLMSLKAVEFVDVAYVHFEDDDIASKRTPPMRNGLAGQQSNSWIPKESK